MKTSLLAVAAAATAIAIAGGGAASAERAPPHSSHELTRDADVVVDVVSIGAACAPATALTPARFTITFAILDTRKGTAPETIALANRGETPVGWHGRLYLVKLGDGTWRLADWDGAVGASHGKQKLKPLPTCAA